MFLLISLFLLSIFLFPTEGAPVEAIYLESMEEEPKNQEVVFELVNNLRKRLNMKPFKFSESLYQNAEKENKLRMQNYTNYAAENPKEKHFYKRYREEGNITDTIFNSIKNSSSKYRRITDKLYESFAISIIKDYNVYHTYLIFQMQEDKNAYMKEKLDFKRVLKILDKNSIRANQSKQQIRSKVNKILNTTKRKYRILSSPGELTIFQSEVNTPENYIRIGFSSSPGSFIGLNNISVFFKEANYKEMIKWTEQTYNVSVSRSNNDNDIENPFSFYRLDEKERLYFVIDKEKLIRFRWSNEGIYLSIDYLDYSLKYINNHKGYYSLSKQISKWLYYRLLTEFLKHGEMSLSTVDYMNETRVFFFNDKKEMEAYIDKYHIRIIYMYDKETGRRKREEIYKNGIKVARIYN